MNPNAINIPLWRQPLNLHNISKLILIASLILLFINIASLNDIPLLYLYQSSSSSSSTRTIITTTTTATTMTMTTTTTNSTPTIDPSRPSTSTILTPILSPPPSPPPLYLPTISNIPIFKSNIHSSYSTRLIKECDISKGEWVWDPEVPYYTNMTCWMIQDHQNCMKYGRPDIEFLKWRWKPQGCELPHFDPVQFLELVKGKSLAFVGDSLARNHMQSLMCLLSRVEYPKDISNTKDENFKHMFYTNYNFTISIFWSPFLVKSQEGREGPFSYMFWNLHLDETDGKWVSQIDRYDYVVISGGNWFNRPSMFYVKGRLIGCLYCQSNRIKQLSMQHSNQMAFRTALHAINKRANFKGMVILRTLSPSHFENGVWDKGGDCVRTRPFQRKETRLEKKENELYNAQLEEFRRTEKEGRRRGLEFRSLDITDAMQLRPDGHPSHYGHWPEEKRTLYNDCVHWCLPGPIDTWNDFLLHTLSKHNAKMV